MTESLSLEERVEQVLADNQELRDRVQELENKVHETKETAKQNAGTKLISDQPDDGWFDDPPIGRRGALTGAAGLLAIIFSTGSTLGQSTIDPDLVGAACEWLGDQQAAQYRLFNLGLLHNYNHSDATSQDTAPGSLAAGEVSGEVRPYWDFGDGNGLVELATASGVSGAWIEQDSDTLTPKSPYQDIRIRRVEYGDNWRVESESVGGVERLLQRPNTGGAEQGQLAIAPIGDATQANYLATNDPNLTNYEGIDVSAAGTEVYVQSLAAGTGTLVPLRFKMGSTDVMSIPASADQVDLENNDITNVNAISTEQVLNSAIGDSVDYIFPAWLARTNAQIVYDDAQTLDGKDQKTSGSGSISIGITGITLATGSTSGSHARLRHIEQFGGGQSPTWNKDRTVLFYADFQDTDGPVFSGSGRISKGTFTTQHIGVKMNGGDLVATVADGTTEATTTLISGASPGVKEVRIEFTSGSDVQYIIDGTNQGEVTSNLPSGSTGSSETLTSLVENSTTTDRSIIWKYGMVIQHP